MYDVVLTRGGSAECQIRAETPRATRQFKRMGYPPVVGVCKGYALALSSYLKQSGLRCDERGL